MDICKCRFEHREKQVVYTEIVETIDPCSKKAPLQPFIKHVKQSIVSLDSLIKCPRL